MDFSEEVLSVRSDLHLSQKELAQQLGVTNVTISRWENDKSTPTKRQRMAFYKFCKANGIGGIGK